ncbi:hypothetical protein F5144DRAFT_578904 [Chaetomium tenue]|uniref:Uncharacterized protein n=1 Tax=Chaetomium tenue TaxID=1854479 RepID=A0ACB7P7X4_9PEZI|nr:hypothetical protein F5144DRAFT_578904 [Chaetomium globosum]
MTVGWGLGGGGIRSGGCIALHGGVLAVIFCLFCFTSVSSSFYLSRVVLITALRSVLYLPLSSVDIRIADTLLLFIIFALYCVCCSSRGVWCGVVRPETVTALLCPPSCVVGRMYIHLNPTLLPSPG